MNNLSEEEKKAIDKLKAGKKIGIYELIRTFKREGIENFVTTRKKYVDTILNLIENQQKEIEELKAQRLKEINNTKYWVHKDKIREKARELTAMSISGDIYYEDVHKIFEDLLGELL